jgi:hypothetical protein
MTTTLSFGATPFGSAPLGPKKRTACWVKSADLIYRHPGGTLPHKLQAPKHYKAMDRLVNRPEVTHAAVLPPHRVLPRCAIEERQFTTSQALQPRVALLSVVAVGLLQLRQASRRRDAQERPATDLVDASYVAVLSRWRYKDQRRNLSVHDFFDALARLGGHQNRKGDHRPGWLVLWRGWMALQHMVDGAEAVGFKIRGQT